MNLQYLRRSLALLIDPTILPQLEALQHKVVYHKGTIRGLVRKLRRIALLANLSVREGDYER